MKFPCPKCGLTDQVGLSKPLDNSTVPECPRCLSRIYVNRELKNVDCPQDVTTYCANCGKSQSYSDRCQFCESPFTGFLFVTSADGTPSVQLPPDGQVIRPVENPQAAWIGWWLKMPFRFRLIGISLILLLSLTAGLITMQYVKTHEQEYFRNYVLALYGIKSGVELSSKICLTSFAEWQKDKTLELSSGQMIDSEDKNDLETVKKEVDRIMGELGRPVEHADDAAERLAKLYEIYGKLHAMALKPTGNLPDYGDEVPRLRAEFARTVGELKAHMPVQLAAELARAGTKYDLDFVNH